MRRIGFRIGAGIALAALAALAIGAREGRAAPKKSVLVMVPCGQEGPFREVSLAFEAANPGVKVEHETENIVTMTRRVRDGQAAPDVFLSMGDLEMNLLEKAGKLVPGTRTRYAQNSLALLVPQANPGKVARLEDLAGPGVRQFVLANPKENSVGLHGQQALEKAGLWSTVRKKAFFPQMPDDVKQLLAQNKAQAGFAYWPCVTEQRGAGAKPTPAKRVKLIGPIPQRLYPVFFCEAASIKGCRNPELGRRFVSFLKSPQAQKAYRRWNFTAPKA